MRDSGRTPPRRSKRVLACSRPYETGKRVSWRWTRMCSSNKGAIVQSDEETSMLVYTFRAHMKTRFRPSNKYTLFCRSACPCVVKAGSLNWRPQPYTAPHQLLRAYLSKSQDASFEVGNERKGGDAKDTDNLFKDGLGFRLPRLRAYFC